MQRSDSPRRSGLPRLARMAAACALTLGVFGNAHAQSSVTLYGILDAGIQYLSHADGQHGAVNLQNYGVLPSQIGITGREDLGGGVQVIFRLEQGLNVNDGTATVPGLAFFRGAWVGLTGRFGTVTFGRQFSVLFDRTLFYDPLYYAAYSGQGELVPLDSIFVDNAVKYQTADLAGFSGEALAATGGVPGNSRSGRVLEAGAQYAGNGFGVSAVIHQSYGTVSATEDTSAQQSTIGALAAHWDLSKLSLYGGVERQTGSLAPAKTVAWGGARYRPDTVLSFAAGIYHTFSNTPSVGHPTLYVASATYALSKRTFAYLNLGYSHNTSGSSQPVYEYDSLPIAGVSQFGAMTGLSHTF
ncbi:porin [Paraburkholderia sp. J63]|uniref:porin n=1 Tax=Paraburkholderia sp. J63 TaxID=2805434 RepID=UPI0039F53C31